MPNSGYINIKLIEFAEDLDVVYKEVKGKFKVSILNN